MKKIGIMLVLSLLLLGGCGEKPSMKEIKLTEFFKMMDNDKDFMVFFSTSSCSACAEYKLYVEEVVSNYQVTVYYVVLDYEDTEDKETLVNDYIGLIEFTPTTYFIQSGEVVHKFVGTKTYRDLKNEMVKYGYIDED